MEVIGRSHGIFFSAVKIYTFPNCRKDAYLYQVDINTVHDRNESFFSSGTLHMSEFQ